MLPSITKEYLEKTRRKIGFKDPIIFEKCTIAFFLLKELLKYYPDVIFKGGTAVLLHKFPPLRFSIDVDIVLKPAKKKNLLEKLKQLAKNSQFFNNIEEDLRESKFSKEHHKFYYRSKFTNRDEYVLLDTVYCDNPYHKLVKKSLKEIPLFSIEGLPEVNIPTSEGLLSDKMIAISFNTLGIPLDKGKEMEFVK